MATYHVEDMKGNRHFTNLTREAAIREAHAIALSMHREIKVIGRNEEVTWEEMRVDSALAKGSSS